MVSHYAPIPPSLGFAEAAALPVALETATRSLDVLGVEPGRTLLVNGATGGSAAPPSSSARGAHVSASPVPPELLGSRAARSTS